jgi:hypothetical protein
MEELKMLTPIEHTKNLSVRILAMILSTIVIKWMMDREHYILVGEFSCKRLTG